MDRAGFFQNHITSVADKSQHKLLYVVDKIALVVIRIQAFIFLVSFIIGVIGLLMSMFTHESFGESVKRVVPIKL